MSKPLKIIYLIENAAPYGSNVALLNLLEMLIPKGVKPLVVMSGSGGISKTLIERDITYLHVKYYYSIYPRHKSLRDIVFFIPILCRTILFNFIATIKLTRIARNYQADLIHTNIGPLHIGYHVAKKLNIPHIWHIREYQELYLGWHPLFSRNSFIKKLNSKNCHPISITTALYKHYSMKENTRVIPDGVMKISQKYFNPQKEKYFLFVGRLEEAKGIRQLIICFAEFAKSEKDTILYVAGDGTESYKNILLKLIEDLKISERVLLLGFRNDIHELMSRALALIVPSSFEGFGFTTVEAMFNGCLVIGKNASGTREIIEQDRLGILYSENNELVAAMKNLVSNGIESYLPIIQKSQEVASKLYSCEQNAEDVFKFYQETLNIQTKKI